MKEWLLIGTAAFAAGAGGFFLGHTSSKDADTNRPGRQIVIGGNLIDVESSRGGGPVDPIRAALIKRYSNSVYSTEDLEEDLHTAFKAGSPVERYASLAEMLDNLSPENLSKVLAAFRDIPMTPEHLNEYKMLLYAWTKFDREGAMKFIEDNERNSRIDKADLLDPVMSSWATEDPEKALAWFQKLPEEQRTHQLEKSLISGWAANNPHEAAKYLEKQKPDRNREYLIGEIANHMFKESTSGATNWAESIKDPKFKEQAFEELTEDWVSVDPEAAADWLRGYVHKGYAKEAIEDLGRGWIKTDPDAATDWFASLPESWSKSMGVQKMARSWAEDDLAALGEWLNEQPDSGSTDLGVQAYSERLMDFSPESALGSALNINNDGLRNKTVQDLGQKWYREDPDSAAAWAQANNYPVEQLMPNDEIYAKINAQQLDQVNKMLNQAQASPQKMAELRAQQEALLKQAAELQAKAGDR